MYMRAFALSSVLLALGSSAFAQSEGPAPAISGIAAAPDGNLLVSPPPQRGGDVVEIAPDGTLAKSWPVPEKTECEVVDATADGRPVCLDVRANKVWFLAAGDAKPDWLLLTNVKGVDPRALAPVVRASGTNEILVAAADASAIYRVSMAGTATKVALAGAHSGIGDLDVSSDGRIAVLDPVGGMLRVYGPDGSLSWEAPVAAPGAAPGAYYAVVRFVPGSGETWVLDLPPANAPPAKGAPQSGLQRFDEKGKRVARLDRYAGGGVFESAAGIAPTKDGVWIADLSGEARRIDRTGALKARFDCAPPPPGVSWNEKQRLLGIAKNPDRAPIADLVAALGVARDADEGDALMTRLIATPKEAAPLLTEATAKFAVSPLALATFLDRTQPETRDVLAASFKHAAPAVRAAGLAVLRDPAIQGFDDELVAATKDPAPEVRGGALVVLSRQRWNVARPPLFIARLDDENPEVALLSAQLLAARLNETVDELAAVVSDAKASKQARELASRALLLEVPGGDQVPVLPSAKRAVLGKLAGSPNPAARRVGVLALIVHGDPKGGALFPSVWATVDSDQKKVALANWSPANGDKGASALISILGKEKDPAMRALLMRALHRNGGVTAKNWLTKTATARGKESDRIVALDLAKRRLSDDQIIALAGELTTAGSDLRRSILKLIADRGVASASGKVAGLLGDEKDRADAFVTLYRLGSKDGVKAAIERVDAGKAGEIELSYLASVGGIPAAAQPRFEAMVKESGERGLLAAEALARSGNATGLSVIVEHVKADRYGEAARDGALPGSLAALGDAGRKAAAALLDDPNPAVREDAALTLALQGGDSCKDLTGWKTSAGVSVPAAFYALATCGQNQAAIDAWRRAAENPAPGDPVSQTAVPEAFASLLSQTLRQPDFRPHAEPVLAAVAGLPRPVVTAVATALSTDLDPGIAGAAMKYVFGSLGSR